MHLKLFPLLLFFVFGAFLINVKAVSYGYSYMDPVQSDPSAGITIYAETGTVLDYNVWLYYDPGIQAFLYENSNLIASTERIMNYNGPVVYVYTDPEINANYGRTYTIHGDHYLGSLIGYSSGGQNYFYDYYGFNYYAGNFPSPYNFSNGLPLWYSYQIYRVATTQVSISVQRPLHLDSIDTTGGVPGASFVTTLRGTGLFGTGTGQGANQTVQVSGSGVTATVQPTSPNTIEVLDIQINIASNAAVGDRTLTLTVNGQTSNSLSFRVGDNSPQITSISPDEGNSDDQVSVTITGQHFGFNPDVEIEGLGIARAITSSTTTTIEAIFSVAENANPGTRGVKVRSRGISGTGFSTVPGNTDRSNIVDFNVLSANPSVTFPSTIGSVEKGSVKTIIAQVRNAPQGHITKFSFKNKPTPTTQCPASGCVTGAAVFENGTPDGATEFVCPGTGDYDCEIKIRGLERSSSTNNVDIEARFNNDPNLKKEKSFTVSSVEFNVNDECNGVDVVEFERMLEYDKRFLFVKKNNSNTIKVKVVPSGASGSFKLEPANSSITVSQTIVNSTSSQVLTVNANATAGALTNILVKPNNTDPLSREAEVLKVISSGPKQVTIEMYGVTEDNDDVPGTPPGQGTPNSVAYVFSEGANNFIDTVAGGDDWLAPVPIGQRPPGYSSRSRRVITGNNGILETTPQGDDQIFSSKDKNEMLLYAPLTEIGNGLTDVVCIRSGPNQFLDSITSRRDYEAADPTNPALRVIMSGGDGRCDSDVNDDDILPPDTMRNAGDAADFAADLEEYLNDDIWLKQANVTVTVNPTVNSIAKNFDLNRDKKLENVVLSTPTSLVEADAIIGNQSPPANTYNLYFVGMPVSKANVLGYVRNIPSKYSFYGDQFWSNDKKDEVIAHEIGHLFGSNHPDSNEFYKPDLMYFSRITGIEQCRVRKQEWDRTTILP